MEQWSKVAKALQGVVKVGAVNCDDEKALCSEHGCAPSHIGLHLEPFTTLLAVRIRPATLAEAAWNK